MKISAGFELECVEKSDQPVELMERYGITWHLTGLGILFHLNER